MRVYNNAAAYSLVTSPDETDTVPGSGAYDIRTVNSNGLQGNLADNRKTDISGQIRHRHSDGTHDGAVEIFTKGWIDPRGRNA
jgi:hypothetical protein